MVASTRTVAQGALPIGSLIGGGLGATLGVVPTLIIAGVLMGLCGSLALVDPDLRRVGRPRAAQAAAQA
jgi:hypothetical protein